MAFNLEEWYKKVSSENSVVTYKGNITADLITDILNAVEEYLENSNEVTKVKKKIYNVLIEGLQNLYHHVDCPPQELQDELGERFFVFILQKTDDSYKMLTGNFIHRSKIKFLQDRIDQINYLSKEELKTLYKLILNNQEFSKKGGGGLGMIDIAKRTGNDLKSDIYTYDDKHAFFCLKVDI